MAASESSIVQIKSLPGIKRDGTRLEGDAYVDGQWVRFQRGLPRKIGGYRSISKYLTEISTQLSEFTVGSLTYIHSGSPNLVEQFYLDSGGNASIITDRTPTSGFTANPLNMWQFAVMSDGVDTLIFAQVAPNATDICNQDGGEVFSGVLTDGGVLTTVAVPAGSSATGGVVALFPYAFMYGSGGSVAWSVPGDPTDFTGTGSGAANITSQKIIRALPLRGGPGNSPSGLFWSADSLVRVTFVGGDTIFQFDTLSNESSILSANGVIEYDGVYFWLGVDRMLMFNGVVREVENNMNINYFYDGLNFAARQKVFAFKVPRFGEIWWCYPRGQAVECSHYICFNVRENTWSDGELPNGGRSAGLFPAVFAKPLLTGVDATADGYKLWIHEVGSNAIDGQTIQPIMSFFETADISLPVTQGTNQALQVLMVEPDFVQVGPMSMTLTGNANARSPTVDADPVFFPDQASITVPQEQVLYEKAQRRQLRFRFESNTIDGDFQMGTVLAHLKPGDSTTIG